VPPSVAEIERDVGLGRAVHSRLLEHLRDNPFDAHEPSRLPGWNRAQVLTHLARNADGHRRMIEGAARGEVLEQYQGGVEGRNAGIDAGADVTAGEALEDFATATAALEAAWATTDWQGFGRRTLAGDSPIGRLPFLRTREVSLHGIDLDVGIELSDLDPRYVDLEMNRLQTLWPARQTPEQSSLPPAAVALAPIDRLGWLTGRLEVNGLAPAGLF